MAYCPARKWYRMALWRKILLLLVITLAVVAEMCAQGDYARYARYLNEQDSYQRRGEMGLTLGASFMGVEPAVDAVSISPKIGVRAALEYSMVWADDYALQLEVAYISNKADIALAGRELELRSNVVEVPVLFSYRGLQPVRIGAGVVLSPMASGRYETEFERLEFGQLRQMVGYVVDAGVSLTPHLMLDARFTGSFGKMDNYFEGVEFTTRSWWLSVGIGYMF